MMDRKNSINFAPDKFYQDVQTTKLNGYEETCNIGIDSGSIAQHGTG